MPDPALLALVRHFASPPPAFIEQVVMADAEPFLSAHEAIADDQDQILREWLVGVEKLEKKTRLSVSAKPNDFSPEMFDELVGPFQHYMRWQRRDTARLERSSDLHLSKRARLLKERTLQRQRQRYDAADHLVAFLREIRGDLIALQMKDAPRKSWTPNETTAAAMKRARAGKLEFVTLDDLRASILADD